MCSSDLPPFVSDAWSLARNEGEEEGLIFEEGRKAFPPRASSNTPCSHHPLPPPRWGGPRSTPGPAGAAGGRTRALPRRAGPARRARAGLAGTPRRRRAEAAAAAAVWNHFQYSIFWPCLVRAQSGRPAAHPTASGWDEELLDRAAGVRLPRQGRSESSFRTDPSTCPIMPRHRYR